MPRRRSRYRNPYTYYEGTNPIFMFPDSGYDPINIEREKGERMGQNIDQLSKSVMGVLETNRASKEALYEKMPSGKAYKSDQLTAEAGRRMKDIEGLAATSLKDNWGFLKLEDSQRIQNEIEAFDAWDKTMLAREKEIGEAYKYINNPANAGKIDVKRSRIKLANAEKDLLNYDGRPMELIVPKPMDYKKYVEDAIKASAAEKVTRDITTIVDGKEVTKTVTTDISFTNPDGTLSESKIKEFLKGTVNQDVFLSVLDNMVETDSRFEDYYQKYLNNEIDISDLKDVEGIPEAVAKKFYDDTKHLFPKAKYGYKEKPDTSADEKPTKIVHSVNKVESLDLPTRTIIEEDEKGNVLSSAEGKVSLVGINEITDAKGDKIVLSNIRVPGALFLDDLTQGREKGIYTEKFVLEGVGYARGVNAMIDEILKKGKKLDKLDRDYIRKMKSQVDEGELYAYGSIDGVSVIVPYSEIKGALNNKLDKPYEYGYTEKKDIDTSRFKGVPTGGF